MKDIKFAKEIEEIIRRGDTQPERLNKRLELTLVDCSREEKWSDIVFRAEEWCLNPSGGVHGGAISSIFDTAMGMTAVAYVQMNVSTTDLSVSFLKPMDRKKYLYHIELTHVGRRMIRATGKAVEEETGKVCATAMASFMIIGTLEKDLQV